MIDSLFIAGQTGSGKSYYFEHRILPELLKDKEFQTILLDMKNQYHMGLSAPLGQIKTPMDLANIEVGNYTKGRKPPLVVLKADMFTPSQIETVFEYLCKAGKKVLVFEEAAFYFEDLKGKPVPFWTKRFFRQSLLPHNNDNRVILITQYPTDIPKLILGQLDKGIIFKLKDFQLKYLHEKDFLPSGPEAYPFPEDRADFVGKFYEVK